MLNHKIITTIVVATLAILMASSMILLPVPTVTAHTPGWDIPTYAFVSAVPNPIGVGQRVDILMWLDKVRSGATITNDYRMHNYNLTIVNSAGDIVLHENWDTVIDTTSSQYYAWVPSEAGNYTVMFTFPGFEVNDYPSATTEQNDTLLPSKASTLITVQEEPIPDPVTSYPLPTEYWTRPIYGENTDWWSISSNWLGTGSPNLGGWSSSSAANLRFQPDGVGPQTAHIMWTKPLESGGVVGGLNNTVVPGTAWFEGSAYLNRYTNPIIVAGKLYYNPTVGYLGTASGPTTCVDLRTGKVLWSRSDVPALSFAYIFDVQTPNQHGVYPALLSTNNWAQVFDADTGEPLFNVTGISGGGGVGGTLVEGPKGEQLRYTFFNNGTNSNPDWYLCQWNSTNMWNWGNLRPPPITETLANGATAVVANRGSMYDWNVSIPWREEMGNPAVISAIYNDVMILRSGNLPLLDTRSGTSRQDPYTYFAVSLKSGHEGALLWTKTYNPPAGNVTVYNGGADPQSRVFLEVYKETRQWVGYSMDDGSKVWGPTEMQGSFDYYGQPYFPILGGQIAYGKLYSAAYAGIVYCYDMKTGNLLWTYGNGGEGNSTNAGFYVAYGNYPTFVAAVGNDVVYTITTEHTVSTPLYKGAMTRAINATDGSEIWKLSAYTGSFSVIGYGIADGFATFFNGYDNQIYVVGRGPSELTVEAPKTGIDLGKSLIISGTVTDISSGSTQDEQAARFPHGLPVASDASMTDWMGYLYQQKPMPTDFTGVEVTINVVDSNGNFRSIGTATTDASGMYSLHWTPDIEGKYTVIASFAGTKGYWPSYSETSFAVDPAPATPTPTTAPFTDVATNANLMTFMAIGVVAIIIAIAIVGLLILRKRP